MKRVLMIVLSLALMITFVSCDKKNTSSDVEGIDVEYYAKIGKVPECEYRIGSKAEDILSKLKAENGEESSYYGEMESGDYKVITTSGFNYFYKKDAVCYIVDYDVAYGYDIGTISIEIKKDMSARGFETSERDLTEDEKSFIMGALNCTCFEYNFGKNTVLFVFQDNALCATVLHN